MPSRPVQSIPTTNSSPISRFERRAIREFRQDIRYWVHELESMDIYDVPLKQQLLVMLPRLYVCCTHCRTHRQFQHISSMMLQMVNLMRNCLSMMQFQIHIQNRSQVGYGRRLQ